MRLSSSPVLLLTSILILVIAASACGRKKSGGGDDDDDDDAGSPVIAGLLPDHGPVGLSVLISGTHFGATQGTSVVMFGDLNASIVSWGETEIYAEVPDLLPGATSVAVSIDATDSNAVPFTVELPAVVYVNNSLSASGRTNTISAFAIDPGDGSLSAVAGSPFPAGDIGTGASGENSNLVIDRARRRLFASNQNSVAAFDIDGATGALNPVSGSPFAVGTYNYGLALNAAGTRLFVANGAISVLAVNDTGGLAHIAGSPFDATDNFFNDTIALTPDESFLFANNENTTFTGYSLAADGTPTKLTGSPFTAVNNGAVSCRMAPDVARLYFPAYNTSQVSAYDFDAAGAPTAAAGSPTSGVTAAGGFAFTPDGTRLYVSFRTGNQIYGFDVAADGSLTAVSGSPWTIVNSGISAMTVSLDGSWLFAVDYIDSRISVMSLSTGVPVEVNGSPFSTGEANGNPNGVAVMF